MIQTCMDLLSEYLSDCSPYIMELTYDLGKREVSIVCAKNINDWTPGKQLKFTDVIGFTEETFEDFLDDDNIDSLIGLHKMKQGSYCLHTEKRELVIHTVENPTSEVL